MRYELKCPACGHDASEHNCGFGDEQMGCEATDSTGNTCICTVCSASLYAAECERLMGLLQPMPQRIATLTTAQLHAESERDAARAECRRYKAALEEIVEKYELMPQTLAHHIARTALDGQEKDNG